MAADLSKADTESIVRDRFMRVGSKEMKELTFEARKSIPIDPSDTSRVSPRSFSWITSLPLAHRDQRMRPLEIAKEAP